MARRDPDDKPSEVPPRQRLPDGSSATGRSRITEARGYHPRGRTVGESVRPVLRLVPDAEDATRTRPRASTAETSTARPSTARPNTARPNTARTDTARTKTARRSPIHAHPASSRRVGPPRQPRLADQARRLRLGTAVLLALFIVIAGRLVAFQVTDAPTYAAQGLAARLQPVNLPAPRGSILDRYGAVLAGSAEARYVFADPDLVKDPAKTADALSPVLGIPRSELLPRLAPHRRGDGTEVRFEYLARGVPVTMGQAVSALNLAGIGVRRDESRVVPGHDLAANLIGFTGRELTGLGGLEASYDELLRGIDGMRQFEIGQPAGEVNLDHEIPGGYHEEIPARPGSSLQLTIDRDLQFEVQRVLGVKMRQAKAITGSAVVLDLRTGEVLAQASYPFYDAANPFNYQPGERGDAASGIAVDPGSVHKAIVVAACLQEGIVAPGDSVLVPSSITKGGTRFSDTHPHAQPVRMTLPGILAWSSNLGTITLADQLGAEKLYEYQRAFGLGEPTGENLPGESAGLVQPPANWSEASHGSIPIGMGVSVTPLQMAAVYAAIANGGVWVRPHLVRAVIAPDGKSTPAPAEPTRRVISAENASALRTMLEAVVTVPGATGLSAKVDGYRVAGKTGTGKLVQDGKYVAGEVASFIGMAPADAPRYVIAVFAHTPGGNGGVVAGPAFAELMEYTLSHFRVAPTGTNPPKFRVYP